MSGSHVPWAVRRSVIAAVVLAAGLVLLGFGTGPLGIGAVVFGLALTFGGGYELAMRVAQIRQVQRDSR
jgi:hypothetical protein